MKIQCFRHTRFSGYARRDIAGVIEHEVGVAELGIGDRLLALEARVARLTELLGAAVSQMTDAQQREFATNTSWSPTE